MNNPKFILEIPTRVWLRELGNGRPISLADVPEQHFTAWAESGFDAVWLMGVWLLSAESRRVALEHSGLREEYSRALPDWNEADVAGSPFAICGYEVNPDLGGAEGLARFRERLAEHGMRLILDFVPNHTARDHPWITAHPDWYITGTEADVVADPSRWFWVSDGNGLRAVAHGRDPNFPAWTDTAQLNYFEPDLQAAMRAELLRLSTICDGVRCDVAMLILSSVFERVWNRRPAEFWPPAIAAVRRAHPDFFFMAECYWGTGEMLLEMGFDAVYDKALVDEIADDHWPDRAHFDVPAATHGTQVRFLENHDELRIASRMDFARHRAAATWILGLPSVRLLHDGQTTGWRTRTPVQLARRMIESADNTISAFYQSLLSVLKNPVIRDGHWQLLSPRAAWQGNDSHRLILGQSYENTNRTYCIFVNAADTRSQCWVHLGLRSPAGSEVELRDLLSEKIFVRDGIALMLRGLYLDMEPWEAQIFDCTVKTDGGHDE
jgi:hypothetical protein